MFAKGKICQTQKNKIRFKKRHKYPKIPYALYEKHTINVNTETG